uniref:Uncharacterized protein n=1 Tax=Anguilla anguilla TaxID=7936 RepID=A0A0E9SFB8_ANGAN
MLECSIRNKIFYVTCILHPRRTSGSRSKVR